MIDILITIIRSENTIIFMLFSVTTLTFITRENDEKKKHIFHKILFILDHILEYLLLMNGNDY